MAAADDVTWCGLSSLSAIDTGTTVQAQLHRDQRAKSIAVVLLRVLEHLDEVALGGLVHDHDDSAPAWDGYIFFFFFLSFCTVLVPLSLRRLAFDRMNDATEPERQEGMIFG